MHVPAWPAVALLLLVAGPAAAQPIEAQPLATLDLFSTGAGTTGLPPTLWRGSSAALARDVFARLGTAPMSPAARETALVLLRTGAAAPDGAGNDRELAGARAAALLRLGDAAGAATVLDRTPGLATSSALSAPAAEAALYLGDDEGACRVAQALGEARDASKWVRLRAYCDAIGGRTAQAGVALRLLEQGGGGDGTFGRLMNALLAGEGATPGAASLRTALHAALSRRLALDVTPALATAAPAALQGLALDGQAPITVTGLAATRAAVLGLLTPAQLETAGGTAPAEPEFGAGALGQALGTAASSFARPARLTASTVEPLLLLAEIDGPERVRARQGVLLMAAAGAPLTGDARAAMLRWEVGSADAAGARRLALDLAADDGLKGDTALVALDIALSAGADGPKLADRIEIVRALREAGLPQWRAWAREGLERLAAAPAP